MRVSRLRQNGAITSAPRPVRGPTATDCGEKTAQCRRGNGGRRTGSRGIAFRKVDLVVYQVQGTQNGRASKSDGAFLVLREHAVFS